MLGVTSASASGIVGDPGQDLAALQDIQHLDWAIDPGILSGPETEAVAEAVAGSSGILAMGPIGLVAGGVMVIQAVWDSGLGSAIGTWLANPTPLYTDGSLNNEQWCPYAQTSVTGPFGTATNTLPTSISSSCGNSSTGFRTVAEGAKAPPYSDQYFHAKYLDTDHQNYYTLQWQGNCLNGISNQGVFNLAGNAGDEFSMIFNTDTTSGNYLTGSINTSGRTYQCLNSAFSDWTLNGLAQFQVAVHNDTCVIETSGAGPCGSSGATCKQEALLELGPDAGSGADYKGDCYFPVATVQQMLDMLGGMTITPCGLTGQPTCVANANAQAHIGTTTNCATAGCTAALNQISNGDGGASCVTLDGCATAGTVNTSGVTSEVNCFLTHTCEPTKPLPLPRPQVTETYQQYISRLRALGFWGHIYEVNDDMDYPSGSPATALSPQLITEIQVGTATPIPLYWPLPGHGLSGAPSSTPKGGTEYPWPGTENYPPNSDITIQKVPDDYTPAGGPVGGGGPCNCPGLNFGPLTSLDYGSKFPFGAFGIMSSIFGSGGSLTGDSSGTPVTIHLGATSVMGAQDITLGSNEWTDTYRPIVFPILEFLMGLTVVLFALRLIRHPGGDSDD